MSGDGTHQDQPFPQFQPAMSGPPGSVQAPSGPFQSMPGMASPHDMLSPPGPPVPWQSMPTSSPGAPPSIKVGRMPTSSPGAPPSVAVGPRPGSAAPDPFGYPGSYSAIGSPGPSGLPTWSGPASAPPGTLPLSDADSKPAYGRSAGKSGKRRHECGAKIIPGAAFCRKCGEKFADTGQEPVMPLRDVSSAPDVRLPQAQQSLPPLSAVSAHAFRPAEDILLPKPVHEDGRDPKKLRRTVAFIHFGVLLAIFMPPIMLCLNLATNNDFRYFIGSWPLIGMIVLLFIMLVPIIDTNFKVPTWWFIASVWIPVAAFITVGGFTRNDAYRVMAALDNPDCTSFSEKRDLQRAYDSARVLYHQCASQPGFLSIEECAGYDDLFEDWSSQVRYLKAIEGQFPCGGICHESERLWSSTGTQAPACSLFISQWIYGSYIQCVIMTWYSLFVGVFAFIGFEILNPFFREYWDPLVQAEMRGKV